MKLQFLHLRISTSTTAHECLIIHLCLCVHTQALLAQAAQHKLVLKLVEYRDKSIVTRGVANCTALRATSIAINTF